MDKKPQTVDEMLSILKSNPNVLGLMKYGSSHGRENHQAGDYDLFIFLRNKENDVEGLHFYVSSTPIDLNIRTLRQIKELEVAEGFERTLLEGRIMYDPTREVSREIEKLKVRHEKHEPRRLSEHSIAFSRHGHRHVFDKIKGRLGTDPLFSEFLLNTNIYWLVQTYFNVRNLPYKGEKYSFNYLEQKEPGIYHAIQEYYSAKSLQDKVETSKKITKLVLKPVGGPWRNNEILAFGEDDTKDLQNKGKKLFEELFPMGQ